MKIISGKFKGKEICSPQRGAVRPTMSATKVSLFAILENLTDFTNTRILDLYAGSGALGFESLSRGARHVTFVENNKKITECIYKTAKSLCLEKNHEYKIACISVDRFVEKSTKYENDNEKFDIIFSDAPYISNVLNGEALIKKILATKIFTKEAIFVIETPSDIGMPEIIENKCNNTVATIFKTRKFGNTSVYFYSLF